MARGFPLWRPLLIATLNETTLRAWVDEGLTDEQIAARLEIRPYLVTQARRAVGIKRSPGRPGQEREGYLLRLPEGRLEDLHGAARSAGLPTSEWLPRVALRAPELARLVREEGTRKARGKAALAELLTLLLGAEDRAVEPASSE